MLEGLDLELDISPNANARVAAETRKRAAAATATMALLFFNVATKRRDGCYKFDEFSLTGRVGTQSIHLRGHT